MPNYRPISEDPLEIVHPGCTRIPTGGFRWEARTRYEGGRRIEDHYLVGNTETSRLAPLSCDAYLDFSNLEPSPDKILKFANLRGALEPDGHLSGESLEVWKYELDKFKYWFGAWERITKRKRETLSDYCARMKDVESQLVGRPSLHADPSRFDAIDQLLRQVNLEMMGLPQERQPSGVQYELRRKGRGHDITSGVSPCSLRAAVWLGFSECIAGVRKIRKCQAPDCGSWMDVTENTRAKRMHKECARRNQMQRYRQKVRDQQ